MTHPKVLIVNLPSLTTKNVVRDLLYGCWCQGKRIAGAEFPPLDLLFVYTQLKNQANVKLLDFQRYTFDNAQFQKMCKYFDWVIFSSSFQTIQNDLSIIQPLKMSNPNIKTALFGPVSTFYPKILEQVGIDFGIAGDPELALANLVNASPNQFSGIPNLIYKSEGKIVQNSLQYHSLDELSIPDRNPIQDIYFFNPLTKSKRWTSILSSRGCPHRCIFCCSQAFHGSHYRYNSPARMIEEIKYLIGLRYDEFFFRDETFTINRPRVIDFCNQIIAQQLDIQWICNARADNISMPLVMKMKQAGCHTIKFGVESGSQRILTKLKKDINPQQFINAFDCCKKVGLKTHAHMILGTPTERIEDINLTFNLLKRIKPDTVTFNLFTPFPGAPIFNEIINKIGKNEASIYASYMDKSKEYYPELTPDSKTQHLVPTAYRKFYLRPEYILKKVSELHSWDDITQLVKSAFNVVSFIFEDKEHN